MSTLIQNDVGNIRVIQLNHPNSHNPFSEEMETDIKNAMAEIDKDDSVKAVILTGGEGRSFSAGGDFNEVKNLTGGDDVDRWIDRVTDLYASVLKVEKPTIAAIDGHAIGMGFQFAMMFDWRIMSHTAAFRMPELKHGIGCSMGSTILSTVLNYSAMREIVLSCDEIKATDAQKYQLVNEVVDSSTLMQQALITAEKLANYPNTSFRGTKRFMVKNLLDVLYKTAEESKQVHRASFSAKAAQQHFANILGSKYSSAPQTKLSAS